MTSKILLQLLFFLPFTAFAFQYQLSLCAIFHNEARFLKEWIEFHRLQGVEHFYLYNHQSSDNFLEVLDPYIANETVELIEWNYSRGPLLHFNTIQCNAYNDAIKRAKHKTKWLAVIDTDEFLFSPKQPNLALFLKDYEGCAALAVNWMMFGTSNITEIPSGCLMIEYLNQRAPKHYKDNIHIKCIVKPHKVRYYYNPHHPVLNPHEKQINADKVPFTGSFSPYVIHNKIRINHYWCRDEKFLAEEKQGRWNLGSLDALKENLNRENDTTIHQFLPDLKNRCAL